MKFVSVFMSLIFLSSLAAAEVVLGSDRQSISTKANSIEQEYSSDMRIERQSMSYDSTLKMRDKRKLGAGVSIGGSLGLAGANLELNFEDADGAIVGFGAGPGYSSVQLGWKHVFEGNFLAPYTTAGYSRWYNSQSPSSDHKSSDILNQVLTDSEKRTGQFGTDFVYGAAGLQYNQLKGEFAGLSVYAEVMMMAEVKRSVLVPTGAVGSIYYF